MNKLLVRGLLLISFILLSACGGGGGEEPGNDSANGLTTPEATQIVSSESLSQHFVRVELNQRVSAETLETLEFSIVSGSGQALAVHSVQLIEDSASLILETDAQDPVRYTLIMQASAAQAPAGNVSTVGVQNVEESADTTASRVVYSASSTYQVQSTAIAAASEFIGTSGSEPFVMSVTALSNTTVLVTMNTLIDEDYARVLSSYRIIAASYTTPNEDIGRIQVTNVATSVTPKGNQLLTLTTTPQEDIEYQLVMTNIVNKNGSSLIHPDRNGGSFFGIAPADSTRPRLMSVVSTSNSSALATFSEPLSSDAAAPTHYRLCTIAFDSAGNCPAPNQLQVLSSRLEAMSTQVSLTTAPQQSGLSYYLSVTGVTDRATPAPGNAIANPTVAQFFGSGMGAPSVASIMAIDNTHLLVTFTERMDADALQYQNYRVESPPLDIINAVAGDDPWHVVLTTSPQERRDYSLVVSDIHSAEGLLIASAPDNSSFVGIASRDSQAPYLIAAIAETSSRVRLYFSEPLSESALTPSYYQITYCPEFQTCSAGTMSTLPVLSVQLSASDTQVVLTTANIAPRVEHRVVVSGQVSDQAMPLPHNTLNTSMASASFGILLADKVAPSLSDVSITGPSHLTLFFSESVGDGANNPLLYRVCAQTFAADGSCPEAQSVQVLGVELNATHTQVILATAPLTAGTEYFVRVTAGVTDTSGNAFDLVANHDSVLYEGTTSVQDPGRLPQVVGAISTSNISVTVSFSSIMGASALLPENYLFTQENVNGEVGTVFTLAVRWFDDTHTSVVVTTTSQNEVTYRVTVVNVKDNLGNPLDTRKLTVGSTFDPSSALFAGSAPAAQSLELTDSNWEWRDYDNDGELGVSDAIVVNGTNIVLVDIDLDGSIDNWQDSNNNGELDVGDIVTGLSDIDGDGLADNEELRGFTVQIAMGNQVITREVTSDPTRVDTDLDGLTDAEEWAIGSDPRSRDTDADGISDYTEWNIVFSDLMDQDTDDDGLGDGSEHNFFKTSPNLADTDGDQFDDAEEIISLNRNPKIADLPKIAIHVGEVNLHIDERYTYVNSSGETLTSESSTTTSLSSTENTSFANSVMTMDENSGGFSISNSFGIRDAQYDEDVLNFYIASRLFTEFGVEGHFERTTGSTLQIDRESARETQQALENSLNRMNEASKGSEVTRELTGARISANISVENIGSVALTVKNLQVSVSQIDPRNRNKLLPIATLVAESTLITGNDLEINLGPFDSRKGPYIFANAELYPGLVETLMRNPSSLVFKVVNYDIADEYERNFAFAGQLARDRTAGITFDFGELGSESHYVATSGVLNGSTYLGGFTDTAAPAGVPLGYLLETVLGIPKHDATMDLIDTGLDGALTTSPAGDDVTEIIDGESVVTAGPNGVLDTKPAGDDRLRNQNVRTGIIAGADKRVDSIAQGDDVQLVPFGTTGVAPKTLVIDPGSNGVLESGRSGDDFQEFVSGYQLQTTCSIASSNTALVGYFCSSSNDGCSCDGPKGLVRVNTFRNGDFGNTWFVRYSGDQPAAVDFDQIQLKPGQDIRLAFLQDLDKDGLFAHEEFLYGSVDSAVNQYDNSQFRPIVVNQHYTAKTPAQLAVDSVTPDGFADSMDTDRDGIGDYAEAKLGWLISRNGELKRVFSSPALVDSDNDGLWDIQEQDLREFCATGSDPRQDALCAPVVVAKAEATGIIVGKNGRLDTLKTGDDEYAFFVPKNTDADASSPDADDRFNQGLMFATVAILPGPNGIVDTDIAADDEYINASVTLPATDPMLSDTDSDQVSDGEELFGYAVGMGIVEGGETEGYTVGTGASAYQVRWGVANTRAQGDDLQKVFPGSRTKLGEMLVSAGANGILETVPEGDDAFVGAYYIAAGADRVLNCVPSSDPDNRQVFHAQSSIRLAPYDPAIWNVSGNPAVVNNSCFVTSLSEDVPGRDLLLYGRVVVTDPLRRDTDNDQLPDGFEIKVGANPTIADGDNFRDSDFDGLSDAQEANGWVVAVNGALGRLVRSNALLSDSDFDGLPDYMERDIGTNPNLSDTDADTLDDYSEFRSVRRTIASGTQLFSAFDYGYLSVVFPGFSYTINPSAYNTDPLFSDSDGDGLSDSAELITGYRIRVTGQTYLGPVILTDPNKADSDGDGLSDYAEANGITGANGGLYVTDATNADTDGDGTSDDVELASDSLTNPLVPDAQFNVRYDSIFISDLDSCSFSSDIPSDDPDATVDCPESTHVLWWLYASGNDGVIRGKHLVSSSDEFAYTPEGSVRPISAGHTSLVTTDLTYGGQLLSTELPSSARYLTGLKQEYRTCGGDVQEGTDCGNWVTIQPGQTGYNAYASIFWNESQGVGGQVDRFQLRWTGEFYVEETGIYEFLVWSDDGTRVFIDDSPASVLNYRLDDGIYEAQTDDQIWSSHDGINYSGSVTLSAGWHRIQVDHFEDDEEAEVSVAWRAPSGRFFGYLPPLINNYPNYRHSEGDGSYSCIAIERDTTQSSYISLNRNIGADNFIQPQSDFSPGEPYYGGVQGSELKIFRDVMALDNHVPDASNPNDFAESRFYLDYSVIGVDGSPLTVGELFAVATDLAASRNIITGLVKPDVNNASYENSAVIRTDAYGDRYFELSKEGRMLYQQLKAQAQYGEKTFVVKEGESIELSGILMKVDDLQNLTACPIGATSVVSQFGSSCTKRFSRNISYAEVRQQPFMTLNLSDLRTQTYSSSGAGGCDIDLTTTIGLGQ